MRITLSFRTDLYQADLAKPIDISLPLGQVKCFYAPELTKEPYRNGDFVGSVKKGAPVNYFNVSFNPHGNGTHTECLGHITKEHESVNQSIKQFHSIAALVSVELKAKGKSDRIITVTALKKACPKLLPEALIIRTLPNSKLKTSIDYSGSNPPFMDSRAMTYLVEQGVKHLLIDLPSVDREVDKGALAAHHIFWKVGPAYKKSEARKECSISELIYVDNKIKDGFYLLNLQFPPLELDASPSRPVIYKLKSV